MDKYHLGTLKLRYAEAAEEYERCACTRLGRLIANREIPVLERAKALIAQMDKTEQMDKRRF